MKNWEVLKMGEYGPIIISAQTLGEAWERAVIAMMKRGYERWVEAPEYQKWTKDNPMFIMVKNPMAQPRLSPLAKTTIEIVEDYAEKFLKGMDPEKENQFDYTYHSRLMHYPDCKVRAFMPNITNDEQLKEHVQKVSGGKCIVQRINQVEEAIKIFKKDPSRRSVVMHTWIPLRDLAKFTPERKDTSSPCLVLIHPQLVENALHFNVVMKTNDLFNAWPGNAYAFSSLQKYMAEELGVDVGHYTHFSVSMQIYEDMYEAAKEVMEKSEFKD